MLVSLSQIILEEKSFSLEQAIERSQTDGVTIGRAANLQALEEKLDCLDPSLLNALKRSHRYDYIPGGFLNRKRKELIRQVKSKSSAGPATPKSYPAVSIHVPEALVQAYGLDKDRRIVQRVEKTAGVFSCSYDPEKELSLLAAVPDVSARERQNLELVSVHVNIPSEHLANFRSAGVLKGVMDISGCSVAIDEDLGSLVLTGLVSETNAAKLLLDEQVASFDLPQDGKKSKPARNRKKKTKPSCRSGTCAQLNMIPSKNSDVVKNLAVDDKPQTRVVQGEKGCDTAKIVDEGRGDADQSSNTVSLPVVPAVRSDESSKAAADPGSSEPVSVSGEESAPKEDQIVDCVVCLTERPTVAFIPCGHRYTCAACAKKIFDSESRSCPACRETIERCYRIWV